MIKAKNCSENSKLKKSAKTTLFIGSIFVLFLLSLIVNWLVLKWFWPGIKVWYFIVLFICLTLCVSLIHSHRCIMRGRSHRVFIRRINDLSEDFASSHNLMLTKNEYSGSVGFCFKHPQGGHSEISLQKWYGEKPMLFASWQLDDYDSCIRQQKEERKELTCLEERYLYGVLSEALKRILSWRKEDLTSDEKPWNWKKTLTKEEFERFNDKYPIANPH